MDRSPGTQPVPWFNSVIRQQNHTFKMSVLIELLWDLIFYSVVFIEVFFLFCIVAILFSNWYWRSGPPLGNRIGSAKQGLANRCI